MCVHSNCRDGWEKLGLYEYFNEKRKAIEQANKRKDGTKEVAVKISPKSSRSSYDVLRKLVCSVRVRKKDSTNSLCVVLRRRPLSTGLHNSSGTSLGHDIICQIDTTLKNVYIYF